MSADELSGLDESTRTPLPGTVKHYDRHLFICTGQVGWPARIESHGYIQRLSESLAANEILRPKEVKLTACDEPSINLPDSADPGYDILVYPDSIRYLGLRAGDFPALIGEHLVGGNVASSLANSQLKGWHVFVCVHSQRDERCGRCGPPVVTRFQVELARRSLSEEVAVRRCSHVGGHAYAGNVIIYPGGDWYGYMTPEDVPRLIEQHILGGRPVADLWRGRMGTNPEEQIAQAEKWNSMGAHRQSN
jgi:(2Fe-2S) ferredoxin